MDTSLILIILALLVVFHFMSVITLKSKIEGIQKAIGEQKDYFKNIEYSIEINNNKISRKIEEGYNTLIKNTTLLSNKVDNAKDVINKTTKEQVTRIIYLAPTLKRLE